MLASSASLSDEHPTWVITAISGLVLDKSNEDRLALVSLFRRLDESVRYLKLLLSNCPHPLAASSNRECDSVQAK